MDCSTKRLLTLILTLASFLTWRPATIHAGENLLKNPGFEVNAKPGDKSVAAWKTVGGDVFQIWDKEKHGGDYSAKFWWWGGLYQQLPAVPEGQYQLTGYFLNPTSEPLSLQGSKCAALQLQFVSANNETVCTIESKKLDFRKKVGQWIMFRVTGNTPPNASFVRAKIEFAGGKGEGAMCIDDVSLELLKAEKPGMKYSMDLEGEWFFKKGDDENWADFDCADSDWSKTQVPEKIEIQYPDFSGFGWYRFHFNIPRKLKNEPLILAMGAVDDADETYLNGFKIGAAGRMPPDFQTAWDQKRQYAIPPDIIRYGNENILAVRVYDDQGNAGITRRPVGIFTHEGFRSYMEEMKQTGMGLGKPITPEEKSQFEKTKAKISPLRFKTKKLPNGGWTFLSPDKKPFMPVGIEYEPLGIYGTMNWKFIERDLNLIKNDGFNTVTLWCVDFNASGGASGRMSIEEMAKLAEMTRKKGLFIQFYLNIDRFIQLFPKAGLPDGSEHGFDIDYCNPDYRAFIKNFAMRLAMALYPYDNVSTIVVWEEKVGIIADFTKEKVSVQALFGSKWGKDAFKESLTKKHKAIETLNKKWGTNYASFDEAVNASLLDFSKGVPDNEHRQYDVLEFGQTMLIDFTKDFVNAYKSVDSDMLFQCRNFDCFGPMLALDPRYSFLDSYGLNQYSFGYKGYDIAIRESMIRFKLISGIAGTAPYVGNFGFRTASTDKGTHGLVPNDGIKASMAQDSLSLLSFMPEVAGTSYFTYFYKGVEGPWGIIKDKKGEPLPIYHSFKSAHELFSEQNEYISLSDYAEKPKLFIFHGLDAVYDIRQRSWIEHTDMGWSLSEMNLNYEVICDADSFDPVSRPIIIANFHAYDKKIDSDIARKLVDYCKKGGTLVIGNEFGIYDRYVWPNREIEADLNQLRGVKISDLKRGKIKVIVPNNKHNVPDFEIEDTWYVEGDSGTLNPGAEVLLQMDVQGKKLPALISQKFGEGKAYYFLFNPYHQNDGWEDKPEKINRTSLPLLHFLLSDMGVKHDTQFGNRGFNITGGRINLHEEPLLYYTSKEAGSFGTYKDEYGETEERYSGGVITDRFISFRGRALRERGWEIKSSSVTSIMASAGNNKLSYYTSEPVDLLIGIDGALIRQKTESYKLYRSLLKK